MLIRHYPFLLETFNETWGEKEHMCDCSVWRLICVLSVVCVSGCQPYYPTPEKRFWGVLVRCRGGIHNPTA